MADNDFEVYDGTSFKDICKEIHTRSGNKHEQLDLLIGELRPLIRSIDDAQQIVPLIQTYLEISVKNDEQLVKLAQVAQKLQTAKLEKGGGELLSESEKEELWKEVKEVAENVSVPIPDAHDILEK